jgi:hypothetical protein
VHVIIPDVAELSNRRCITNDNMASLRSKLANDIENLDGLSLIDPASQKKVREAFIAGEVLDKDWTGIWLPLCVGH